MFKMRYILPLSIFLCSISVWGQDCAPAGPCPSITLPWGTWIATSYTEKGEFYTFKNIRFGQAPIGELRFNVAVPPAEIKNPSEIQDSSRGSSCIAINPKDPDLKKCASKSGARLGLGEGTPYTEGDPDQSEDCLFLDLYVPRSAATSPSTHKLPVVVWFYGGAYVFGSKNVPSSEGILYGGTSFLQGAKARGEDMIFVVGNYRLGAFGWLAGSYMESHGVPNAGFTDQQLLLSWVQNHIHRVGGDSNKVSAWGESAGGGSILHHLVANEGKKDPVFRKAILQSAAYYWAWNRAGTLNDTYTDFAHKAGCSDIACLRAAKMDSRDLIEASRKIAVDGACTGHMPFGPAVDGIIFKELPAVAFQKQHYWTNISSLILSHVVHEADNFIPGNIHSPIDFQNFLNSIFPSQVASAIKEFYKGYWDQSHRLRDVARDAFFTGNILQLFNAYNVPTVKVYITKYAWPFGLASYHAMDLLPTFYFQGSPIVKLLKTLKRPEYVNEKQWEYLIEKYAGIVEFFAPRYQQYFISHAITGDPNVLVSSEDTSHYTWKPAILKKPVLKKAVLSQVLKSIGPHLGNRHQCSESNPQCFKEDKDDVLSEEKRIFWNKIALDLDSLSRSSTSQLTEPESLKAEEPAEDDLEEIKEEL